MSYSPWIEQLNAERPLLNLDHDRRDEVVIIGGGIAGMTTAYFLLANTSKSVSLLEAGKIAHGATGHNAGLAVDAFETDFGTLADRFGIQMTKSGMEEVSQAWTFLEQIHHKAKLRTPIYRFNGYLGFSHPEIVIETLAERALMLQAGMRVPELYLSDDSRILKSIPQRFDGLYLTLAQSSLQKLAESEDPNLIAIQSDARGCLNSALFVEELAGYLLKTHPKRFQLFEHSAVQSVHLPSHKPLSFRPPSIHLETTHHHLEAEMIILCTNGYELFDIFSHALGGKINERFHRTITGVTGFMEGHLEIQDQPPFAAAYLDEDYLRSKDYFYVLRRPFQPERNAARNLVCVGGPVTPIGEHTNFPKTFPDLNENLKLFNRFWKTHHPSIPRPKPKYQWHGLMGYTPSGVRLVGPDPSEPRLFYNIGCNGIGILPSFSAGARLANLINGHKLAPSMFDPKVQMK